MKKLVYSLMAFLLVATSCSENFLDQDIAVKREIDAFYKTSDDIYGALMDDYSALQNDALTNARWIFGDVGSDDGLKGGESAGNRPDAEQIAQDRPQPNNAEVENLWVQSFNGVTKSNIIIEKIEEVDFSTAANGEDLKNTYRAEALFLRAFNYFYIARAFGDAPLITQAVTDFTDIDPVLLQKKPVEDIWALIESDLQEAISNLPTKSKLAEQGQLGRATKGAAQTLLGKALMFQRKYDEAVPVLRDLINGGEYSLLSDYGALFRPEGQYSSESIFEIDFVNMTSGWGDDCEGSPRVVFQMSRNDWGYGFNQPTQDLVDEFEEGDSRIIYTVNWPQDEYEAGVPQGNSTYNPYGYSNRKIFQLPSERTANVFCSGPNEMIFRLGDIYLLYAEALVQSSSNDVNTALLYLNKVRERANTTPKVDPERLVQAHDVENNDLSLIEYSTDEKLLMDIYHERRVELGMEGIRLWDLIRQGRTDLLNTYYQEWSVEKGYESAGDLTGKFYIQWMSQLGRDEYPVFPVPQSEIDASQGNLTQTTGY